MPRQGTEIALGVQWGDIKGKQSMPRQGTEILIHNSDFYS